MKIELGCGNMKHDGFLGIDLSDAADLKHDLRTPLPFEDNSVDEILAVHVIESFYGWEFPAILADWFRVLKPGGVITIEFTDLRSSAEMYLGIRGSEHKQHGRWGLHGDQSKKVDPIILHHYVYEINELCALMEKTGFAKLNFSTKVEHKEDRDFRFKAKKI